MKRTHVSLLALALIGLLGYVWWSQGGGVVDPPTPAGGAGAAVAAPGEDVPSGDGAALELPTRHADRVSGNAQPLVASDAPGAPAGSQLTGRVVTEAGEPVGGAAIAYFPDPPETPADRSYGDPTAAPWREEFVPWWQPGWTVDDLRPPRRMTVTEALIDAAKVTESGPDGRFVVETVSGSRAAFLAVSVPEHAVRFVRNVTTRSTDDLGDLVVDAGARIRGRVVDPAGLALAGARVSFGNTWGLPLSHDVLTDASGTFEFTQVETGPYYELKFERPGFARRVLSPRQVKTSLKYGDIELHPGRPIRGQVLSAAGLPVAGAHVVATDHPIRAMSGHHENPPFKPDDDAILMEFDVARLPSTGHALTDADGRFELADRRLLNHDLLARHPDHDPVSLRHVVPDAGPVTLRLGERRDLALHVVDPRGEAVPGVDVKVWRLLNTRSGRPLEVRADPTDPTAFRALGIGFRDSRVKATAPGYADAEATITPEQHAAGVVPRLVLEPGLLFSGSIRDPEGEPLTHVNVLVDPEREGHRQSVRVDDRGAWSVEGLPAGAYGIRLGHRSFGMGIRLPEPFTIQLSADTPHVHLDLVGTRGATLEGAITSSDPDPYWTSLALVRPGEPADASSPSARRRKGWTDKYSLTALEPGAWDVLFEGQIAGRVDLVAGETTSFDLVARPQARIDGTVTAAGAPVADAIVNAELPTSETRRWTIRHKATSDENGHYQLRLQCGGAWSVWVQPPGRGRPKDHVERTIEVSEHGVARADFEVPSIVVQGRVLGRADGLPFGKRQVSLRDTEGNWKGHVSSDEQGVYEMRHVSPGRYQATTGRKGEWAQARSESFDVPVGAALVQAPDVLVRRGLSITGTASIAPGVPVPRETDIRLWDVAAESFLDSKAVPEGRFRFDGLEPGTYRLALFADGRGSQLFADDNGHLGQEITLTDSDVEYDLVAEIVPLEVR